MKVIWGLFFVYLLVPMTLYFYVDPDVDQFGKALLLSPMILFVPFAIIFFVAFSKKKYEKKIRKIIDIIMFSIIFSVSSSFLVLLSNMYLGSQNKTTISGIVVEKLPGRGNFKPVLKIKNAGTLVEICIKRKDWETAKIGKFFSVDVKKGSFGLYYKGAKWGQILNCE